MHALTIQTVTAGIVTQAKNAHRAHAQTALKIGMNLTLTAAVRAQNALAANHASPEATARHTFGSRPEPTRPMWSR